MSGLLNKIKQAASGQSTNNNASTTTGTGMGTGMTGGQNEDYGDKGLDALERKGGISLGRSTNERITDAARSGFESVTGKNVPSKYSN